MEKQYAVTTDTPVVKIETDGNLVVKGSSSQEVTVKAETANDLRFDAEDDIVSIHCRSDCTVRVPEQAEVEIVQVRGNCLVKSLNGPLSIGNVQGSLTIKAVNSVQLEQVRGEFAARHIDGDLTVTNIHGNAAVRDVEGSFRVVEKVRGNLKVDNIEGSSSARADGNISLRIDPGIGQEYTFEARGNLFCRLPDDASARVLITKAGTVKVFMPGIQPSPNRGTPYEFTLGDGEAHLTLSAGGNVMVGPQPPDLDVMADLGADIGADLGADLESLGEEIGKQISEQVSVQMEMMENQISAQLENMAFSLKGAGISDEAAERITRRVREASARATARTQEKMQRAQEKLQRKMEAAQRKAEQRVRAAERRAAGHERRGWSFDWSSSNAQSEPASAPVSDEERMMILKMLEEQKITPEEADALLAALEGK